VRKYSIKSVRIISLGICALCAQSIFIRELHSLFSGTEFVLGILLASWMLWVGVGGLAGGRLLRPFYSKYSVILFEIFSVAVSLLLPLTVLAIRYGRGSFDVPSGELPPFGPALLFSVFIFVPFGLLYGLIYNLASYMWSGVRSNLKGGVSHVYIWEALGSFLGAILFSFVLIPIMSQLEAASLIGFSVISVLILTSSKLNRRLSAGVLVILWVIVFNSIPSLDRKSIEHVFDNYRVEHFLTSRYGEVVVAGSGGMISFFSGGGRIFSVPEPERAEETVHIPMLLHPNPEKVLLIGGSLGGGWEEVVKHTTAVRVDCIELDGKLLRLALEMGGERKGFRGEWREDDSEYIMKNKGREVRFITGDGRFFLASRDVIYDVIILDAPTPINLQWNRYYTREFFELVKKSLRGEGIFSFQHESSENYLSREQILALSSLEHTLEEVFPYTMVLPGDMAHFIASYSQHDPDVIIPRLEERGIRTRYINRNYLPFRFSEERISYLREELQSVDKVKVNTDNMPVLPLYEISLEGGKKNYRFLMLLGKLVTFPRLLIPAMFALIIMVVFLILRGSMPARLSIWSIGFTSFLFQMLILLVYQSYSGHLYYSIVIISAVFMGGLAGGAALWGKSPRESVGFIRKLHLIFIVVSILSVFSLDILIESNIPYSAGTLLFLLYSMSFGVLTGFYYRVAVSRALPENGSAAPARFYSWDLLGACMGGAVGGILILPVAGMIVTACFIAIIHGMVLFILSGKW
jgi:spermidine synthase